MTHIRRAVATVYAVALLYALATEQTAWIAGCIFATCMFLIANDAPTEKRKNEEYG